MNFRQRINELISFKKQAEEKSKSQSDIYSKLGTIKPFTALAGGQFNTFIAELIKNNDLNETEKEGFKQLWNDSCIDIDGFGNNIWNLHNGIFTIYEKDDVKIEFEKRSQGIDRFYDQGRANFVYSSNSGSFVISQHERNNSIFLIYVSEDISDRLLSAIGQAEIEALELKKEESKCLIDGLREESGQLK